MGTTAYAISYWVSQNGSWFALLSPEAWPEDKKQSALIHQVGLVWAAV